MAQRARDVRWEARSRQLRCFFLDWGPTPVDEVAQHASETLAWAERQGIRSTERGVRNVLARAEAMRGDFGAARKHIERRDQIGPSTSEPLLAVADAMTDASVDLLEDRPTGAERTLRQAYSTLKEAEGHGPLANVAAMLARALLVEGRDDEAERLAEECAGIAPESQRDAQIKHREIRALVLARRAASQGGPGAGALADEAQALAREAVALSEQSEQLDSRGQALYDLGEVLGRAGRWDEAEEAVERARELWLQKGNLVSADKAPKLLEELRQAGSTG
jgi:tetratricopeptide (TPR) repeat protein